MYIHNPTLFRNTTKSIPLSKTCKGECTILDIKQGSKYHKSGQILFFRDEIWDGLGPEISMLLPSNQRQHRTLHIQKDVLPYTLC